MVAAILQLLQILDGLIDLLGLFDDRSVLVDFVGLKEVAEEDLVLLVLKLLDDFVFKMTEDFLGDFVNSVDHVVLFLRRNELVDKDSLALVSPQGHEKQVLLEPREASY